MKLTRKQELFLIDLGLRTLVSEATTPKPESKPKGRKWTKAQRKKFASTMEQKFKKDTK